MGVSAVHSTGQRARAPGGWGIDSQNRASRAAVPASSHASHVALGEWTHDTCPSCFLGCRPGRARLEEGGEAAAGELSVPRPRTGPGTSGVPTAGCQEFLAGNPVCWVRFNL